MKKLIILTVGLSGSGKSTWANELPEETYSVISVDALRLEFTGDINNKVWDRSIYEILKWRTLCEINKDKMVVIDTTNLQKERRRDFIDSILKNNPEIKFQYKLFESDPELSKRRIKNQIKLGDFRANVPDETIDRQALLYDQMLIDIAEEPITKYKGCKGHVYHSIDGQEFDCGYNPEIFCDDCIYGEGLKDPEQKAWELLSPGKVTRFIHPDQQEVIYAIKTGFEDKWIIVHEDAHEITLGKIFIGTKAEVEKKYDITLK